MFAVLQSFLKQGITQHGSQQAWATSGRECGSHLSSSSNKGKYFRRVITLAPLFLCASLTYPISCLWDIFKHKCAFTMEPAIQEEQYQACRKEGDLRNKIKSS